jgi:hypothetical protein
MLVTTRQAFKDAAGQFVLFPVATGGGDRYGLVARWDATNPEQVDCLTRLFNDVLETGGRTLEQERVLMKGRSERLVYGYGRWWTTEIMRSVRSCNATAEGARAPSSN